MSQINKVKVSSSKSTELITFTSNHAALTSVKILPQLKKGTSHYRKQVVSRWQREDDMWGGGKWNCAWKAGTEARVPGGGFSGPEGEGLKGSRGLLSPRYQSAEASQAVPEPTHTLSLTGSASRMKDGEAKIKMSEWGTVEEQWRGGGWQRK